MILCKETVLPTYSRKHYFLKITTMQQEIKELQEQMKQVLNYSLLASKNVLNFEDLALLTGLSKSHLYKLTCTHQIPYYKPNGKQIYFNRAEIEAWMMQNRQSTQLEAQQQADAYVAQKGGKQ